MIYNNIDHLRKFLNVLDENPKQYVIHITIIARKKENPDLQSTRHIIKDYFITSVSKFNKVEEEIKILSKTFNARVYINLNTKPLLNIRKTLINKVVEHFGQDVDVSLTGLLTSSVAEQNGKKRYFIVDCDTKNENIFYNIVNLLGDKIEQIVNTPNEYHFICNKFDTHKFIGQIKPSEIEFIEVKKNAFTLLYYDKRI